MIRRLKRTQTADRTRKSFQKRRMLTETLEPRQLLAAEAGVVDLAKDPAALESSTRQFSDPGSLARPTTSDSVVALASSQQAEGEAGVSAQT